MVRFKIPQNVLFEASIFIPKLCSKTGHLKNILSRTVRNVIRNGLFYELSPGYFRHTATSASLARNEHIRNIALFGFHKISYITTKLAVEPRNAKRNTKETDQSRLSILPIFLLRSPLKVLTNADASARYHSYLNGIVKMSRWSVRHLKIA